MKKKNRKRKGNNDKNKIKNKIQTNQAHSNPWFSR